MVIFFKMHIHFCLFPMIIRFKIKNKTSTYTSKERKFIVCQPQVNVQFSLAFRSKYDLFELENILS